MEAQDVLGVLGRNGDQIVDAFDGDVGHGEGDQHRLIVAGGVEKPVVDPDRVGRNVEVLGAHLDARVAHQHQAALAQLGGAVVGQRRASPGAGGQRRCGDPIVEAHGFPPPDRPWGPASVFPGAASTTNTPCLWVSPALRRRYN